MNRIEKSLLLIMLCALVVAAQAPAWAQQEGEGQGMPPMGPPEELKTLGFLQGQWDVAVRVKMDPAGEWADSKATSSVTPILEGCGQRMTFDGTMMGMPFKGEETVTYNRESKQFESIWIDSMSAHMAMTTGGWEGDKFIMSGKDVMMGQPYLMRSTMTKASDDEVHWDMEMSLDDGKTWFTNMKMVYTKKAS